jgi:thiol-disulfide isomerase/thioredoxin
LVKKRKALYPNQKTIADQRINEMKQKVSASEESLLSDENYFDFVKNELIADNHSETDENTKVLAAILKLKPGTFHDKMLYWQLNNCIEETNNAKERNQIIATYNNRFGNMHYRDKINQVNRIAESLSKGQKAPDFMASSIDGKQYSLANFKGKYVVIDTWATWCGPCRYQSEYFEAMAIKYKKEKIQFVALSLDERVDNWYVEAKSKPATVMQLHANNTKKLGQDYNISGIPRFILIDPNGNFTNSEMPFPEEDSFEIVLRKAMDLPDNI